MIFKKTHKIWAMYDWANSVYSLIITSTFLPVYYIEVTSNPAAHNKIRFMGLEFINSSLYNYILGFSFLVVALISPLLSAIADIKINRRIFLIFFLAVGSSACAALFFFTEKTIGIGITMIIISCIGFWGSLVFYNAYLPEISSPAEVDKVSALGFKYGYVGSFILQVLCLLMLFKREWFHIESSSLAVRLSFVLVAIWWLGFGLRSALRLPSPPADDAPVATKGFRETVRLAYKDIILIGKAAFRITLLRKFLLSYFFFNMGIQVVMLVATIYGAKELQIEAEYLIITIILIQLLAIVGADLAAYSSQKLGNFLTLFILCIMWIGICVIAYFLPVKSIVGFCGLGAYVGVLMGGSQSLNRSTYSKLIPKTAFNTTYFSFYDVVEKISIVIGMFIFAYLEEVTLSMRNSVLSIILFFLIGGFFLFFTYRKSKALGAQGL